MIYRIEVWKSRRDGRWRWRVRAKNGRILAVSSQGYKWRSDCMHCLEAVTGFTIYNKFEVKLSWNSQEECWESKWYRR